MTTLLTASPDLRTIADLLDRLGGVPARRVRYYPLPGTATEADVVAIDVHEDRICELIDGVLVEKAMGIRESLLAGAVLALLRAFVIPKKLGIVTGPDGTMKLIPGLIRIPDVAYISRDRLPGGRVPSEPAPLLVPDLAVEVLSEGNTTNEMSRKRREYFSAGVRLVWQIDLETRSAAVYTGPEDFRTLTASDALDGGDVLPGFTLSLGELFAELDG